MVLLVKVQVIFAPALMSSAANSIAPVDKLLLLGVMLVPPSTHATLLSTQPVGMFSVMVVAKLRVVKGIALLDTAVFLTVVVRVVLATPLLPVNSKKPIPASAVPPLEILLMVRVGFWYKPKFTSAILAVIMVLLLKPSEF